MDFIVHSFQCFSTRFPRNRRLDRPKLSRPFFDCEWLFWKNVTSRYCFPIAPPVRISDIANVLRSYQNALQSPEKKKEQQSRKHQHLRNSTKCKGKICLTFVRISATMRKSVYRK